MIDRRFSLSTGHISSGRVITRDCQSMVAHTSVVGAGCTSSRLRAQFIDASSETRRVNLGSRRFVAIGSFGLESGMVSFFTWALPPRSGRDKDLLKDAIGTYSARMHHRILSQRVVWSTSSENESVPQ